MLNASVSLLAASAVIAASGVFTHAFSLCTEHGRPVRTHSSLHMTAANNNVGTKSRRVFLQTATAMGLAAFDRPQLVNADGSVDVSVGGKIKYGDEGLMSQKEHGTTSAPVQQDLMYGVSRKIADRICSYNRHFAEFGGYFQSTNFEDVVRSAKRPITFYDSVSGKPLFVAPIDRSAEEFIAESEIHGWPSFRDNEVVWENVRVLRGSGETVSTDGTHLGHNLPDKAGNRYCINLVSIAGSPSSA